MKKLIALFLLLISLPSQAQERIDAPTETFDATTGILPCTKYWKYDFDIQKWVSSDIALQIGRKTIAGKEYYFIIEEQTSLRLASPDDESETARYLITTATIFEKSEFEKINTSNDGETTIQYLISTCVNRQHADETKPPYTEHRMFINLKNGGINATPNEGGEILVRKTKSEGKEVIRLSFDADNLLYEYFEIADISLIDNILKPTNE